MLKFYGYGPCSTCRAAQKFLRGRGIPFTEIPIREQPPSLPELRAMLAAHGGQLRRLFNTSGQDYRAMGLKDRLPAMDVDEALHLLAGHGNLVRRPFLIGPGTALVGFDAAAWTAALKA